MPAPIDANVFEVLVGSGVLAGLVGAVIGGVKWLFGGRKRARVDNAQIVQGMALDLLGPLHSELNLANADMKTLREALAASHQEMDALKQDIADVVSWALMARALLEDNQIDYDPLPKFVQHA